MERFRFEETQMCSSEEIVNLLFLLLPTMFCAPTEARWLLLSLRLSLRLNPDSHEMFPTSPSTNQK